MVNEASAFFSNYQEDIISERQFSYNKKWELLINWYPASNLLPVNDKNTQQYHNYMVKKWYVLAAIISLEETDWQYPEYYKNLEKLDWEEIERFCVSDSGDNLKLIYIKSLSQDELHFETQNNVLNFRWLISKILPSKK